jgi:hypothetical protein
MFRATHGKAAIRIQGNRVCRAGSQAKAWRTRTHRGLPFAPPGRAQRADRQLQITHTSKDMREVANLSNTALAACRVMLAGAAETGARSRHASFDPIRVFSARCWATRTREARQRAPTLFTSKRCKSAPGGVRNRTALPGLGRWADEAAEMRQGHEGKPGLLGTTRECVGLWIA